MSVNPVDLKPLALKIVFDHLATCDYAMGEKVISDVMVIWAGQVINCQPDFIADTDRAIFSQKARNNKRLEEITATWSKGYWNYFAQVKQETVERFIKPTLEIDSSDAIKEMDTRRRKILKSLAGAPEDHVIKLMALTTAEWARRFNTQSFFQFVQENNPAHLDKLTDDANIVTEALYYMDANFQLA